MIAKARAAKGAAAAGPVVPVPRVAGPESRTATLRSADGLPAMLQVCIEGMRIVGVAAAVPERFATVDDLVPTFGRADAEKLVAMTGALKRRYTKKLCTSDLCVPAAKALLQQTGWRPDEIGAMLFVSQTRDYLFPPTSCLLQRRLGLSKASAVLDVPMGCSGYVYGLWALASLMSAGGIRRGMLLVGDTLTQMISPQDRSLVGLMGDAAAATLLELDRTAPPTPFCLGTDGRGAMHLSVPAGGSARTRTRRRSPSAASARARTSAPTRTSS